MASLSPDVNSPASILHQSLTGNPIGDLIWSFNGGTSKARKFAVGAETVHVEINLNYFGKTVNGKIVWDVREYSADQVLVEDIARRVLGRMLAFERFPVVRAGTLSANATEATDASGKLFVSIASWATNGNVEVNASRSVGMAFNYHGKAVQVWTGTDKIKVGNDWKPIGAYVVEINNKLFVPKSGFLAALP